MSSVDTTPLVRVRVASNSVLDQQTVQHVLTEAGFSADSSPESPADVVIFVAEGPLTSVVAGSETSRSVLVAPVDRNDERIADLMVDGVDAVLGLDATPNELAEAVRTVAAGGTILAPAPARRLVELARAGRTGNSMLKTPLTKREVDILQSIGRGESVKETAATLGISAKTVENLQSRMFRKLDVRNRAQAFARAHSLELLPPEPA